METITGKITIQQIFRENWVEFKKTYPEEITENIRENVVKILRCRDPEKMGYAAYHCPCNPKKIIREPFTCKSRFCNTCGKTQTDKWLSSCHKLLPQTDYYHLTLTIPKELRDLLEKIPELMSALFRATADTILSFLRDERGVTPAITCVLHTFGRDGKWHPHIHSVFSLGGLTEDGKWKNVEFIPFKMIRERWKIKLLNKIKNNIEQNTKKNNPNPKLKFFTVASFLKNFFADLYKKIWYIHLNTQRINVKGTIQYIGRYTKRPVLAETRIDSYNGKTVSFWCKDHQSEYPVKITMPVLRFMRQLVRHIPQKNFRMIRHYGLVANRTASSFHNILQTMFGAVKQVMENLSWRIRQKNFRGKDPLVCSSCGAEIKLFMRACFSKTKGDLVFRYV